MTPIDDIKPGHLVALCNFKGDEERDTWLGTPKRMRFDGRPLRVLAVSLPFLAVADGRARFSIDVREWEVKKVSKRYAAALEPIDSSDPREAPAPERLVKKRKKKWKPGPTDCPQCRQKLRQRF